MTTLVSMVPPEHVQTCWPQIEKYIEAAAEYTYGRYTADDIKTCLTDYDYQLWVAFDNDGMKGAVVTNIVTYPRKKFLCMQFCGGKDLKEWKAPMLSLLQKFARDIQCDGIESVGRPGWAKIFSGDGYKSIWVTYELPLGD